MLRELLVLLAVGLVVGLLARAVLPGRQLLPPWLTALLGAACLLLAGALTASADLWVRAAVGTVIAAAVLALTQGRAPRRSRA